jgi:transcriptional regulator with PAS, ATPase and Fis domain
VLGIGETAEGYLLSYDWPGNVRELENAIEHAIVLGTTDQLLPEDLPDSVLEVSPGKTTPPSEFHAAV